MTADVRLTLSGHVAELIFSNPPSNHATVGLLRDLADRLDALDRDPDCRVVVIASEGKVFCAGGDLVSPGGLGGAGDDPVREFYDQAERLFAFGKPIVAAVQGAAVGAGLGLAVMADFRVAAPEARFAANFVKMGFHPGFALSYTLPRLIGQQRAAEMMLTGNRYKAEEVLPWGLVDRIAAFSFLRQGARLLAEEIAVNAPLALAETRATMRAGMQEDVRAALVREHAAQMRLRPTEDHAEGLRAVAERRPGQFVGR